MAGRTEAQHGLRERLLQSFFALAACSWMPHWSCHYFRLETGSGFTLGGWATSRGESGAFLLGYALLAGANLAAISAPRLRFWSALATGFCHLTIGALHLWRTIRPFRFEVFGYPWPMSASAREAAAVLLFGGFSIWISSLMRKHPS